MRRASIDIEEGFVDFTFPIERWEKLPDGTMSVHARGRLNDFDIGLDIDVLAEWRRQDIKDQDLILYWGKARYRSIGKPSDSFLHVLVDQYGLPARDRSMASVIEFSAVAFQSDPREIESSPVTMKLFFEPGPKEAYAELFTNIDIIQGQMEFREKDPEYRIPLVAALDGR